MSVVAARRPVTLGRLAVYFLRLGALGFGGPIALAGYMQRDLVEERGWVTREEYLEGLAASQTLPGPLAAQLAMWLGYIRYGTRGAVASALAFVLPSFCLVTAAGAAYVALAGTPIIQALFYGIGPAVLALIFQGAWKLMRLSVGADRRLWAIFAAVAAITFVARAEIALLFVLAGLVGVALYARASQGPRAALALVPFVAGAYAWTAQGGGIDTLLQLGLFFFKAGAFTFGSGLAIVPFLQEGVVREYGWLTERQFLDAVALGIITPGPVVITAAFVGYLVAGVAGATIAALGVFLPPFLMVVLFAPWITRYRANPSVRGFTRGATAAAAGAIVGAALVIATQTVIDAPTALLFVGAALALWRLRPSEPLLIGAAALAGVALSALR